MIHFESFCKATKLTWISKTYQSSDNTSWKIFFHHMFKEKSLPIIFEGSIANIKKLATNTTNKFWKEVMFRERPFDFQGGGGGGGVWSGWNIFFTCFQRQNFFSAP